MLHFVLGGAGYGTLEVLWRGYTHASMILAGGCGLLLLIRLSHSRLAYPAQCLAGAGLLTVLELAAGCVVNLWLGLGVWDYSDMRLHLWGQVCLLYVVLWGLLSAVMLPLCARLDRLEARLFAHRLPPSTQKGPPAWPDLLD